MGEEKDLCRLLAYKFTDLQERCNLPFHPISPPSISPSSSALVTPESASQAQTAILSAFYHSRTFSSFETI